LATDKAQQLEARELFRRAVALDPGFAPAYAELAYSYYVEVALRYLDAWLRGVGAVAIHHLMEDAATAEISRMQLSQWIAHDVEIDGGGTMTREYYQLVREEELRRILDDEPAGRLAEAAALLDAIVLGEHVDFLTIPGYALLEEL
jgi:malate synthase